MGNPEDWKEESTEDKILITKLRSALWDVYGLLPVGSFLTEENSPAGKVTSINWGGFDRETFLLRGESFLRSMLRLHMYVSDKSLMYTPRPESPAQTDSKTEVRS